VAGISATALDAMGAAEPAVNAARAEHVAGHRLADAHAGGGPRRWAPPLIYSSAASSEFRSPLGDWKLASHGAKSASGIGLAMK